MKVIPKRKSRLHGQKGTTMAFFLMMASFLFGMTAISVDVGHLYLVRAELNNAAVSASLAGAAYLYPTDDDGQPNWSLAEEKALEAISWNSADGSVLMGGTIETGYWDLTGEEPGIRDPGIVPDPGADDLPAVRVVISRSSGNNGGPVPLYFSSFVGVSSKDVSAESVAGAGSPRSVEEGTLFPMALPSSLYNEYWDFDSQKPAIDPSTGEPFIFEIAAKDDGLHGQWTAFEENVNDVQSITDLIESGNPTQLSIGQEIYVVPGVKTSIYNNVPSDVEVTVAILGDTETGGLKEVVGFGTLHIHYSSGGNDKSITVSLTNNLKTLGGSPGGYYYGTYVPPKLVR